MDTEKTVTMPAITFQQQATLIGSAWVNRLLDLWCRWPSFKWCSSFGVSWLSPSFIWFGWYFRLWLDVDLNPKVFFPSIVLSAFILDVENCTFWLWSVALESNDDDDDPCEVKFRLPFTFEWRSIAADASSVRKEWKYFSSVWAKQMHSFFDCLSVHTTWWKFEVKVKNVLLCFRVIWQR